MFRKLKWKLVRFNMALLSLVFIAIFAVTAVLMIAANEQQTQMTLNAALHMRDDGGRQPPPPHQGLRCPGAPGHRRPGHPQVEQGPRLQNHALLPDAARRGRPSHHTDHKITPAPSYGAGAVFMHFLKGYSR